MNIASLIEKAKQAPSPCKPSRSNWSKYVPVIKTLMGNGYNLIQSVHWLADQGEIKRDEVRKAYSSFSQQARKGRF